MTKKSRLLCLTERGPPSWEQTSQSGKEHVSDDMTSSSDSSPISMSDGSEMISSQLENLVQSAVNDLASVGQPQEVNTFIQFMKARFPSIKNVHRPCMSNDVRERAAPSIEALEEYMYWSMRELPSSLNSSDSEISNEKFPVDGSRYPESLLLGKYVAALSKEHLDNPSASQADRTSSDMMKSKSSMLHIGCENFGPSGCDGIHVSSCGHAVHQDCLNLYLVSLKDR